MKNRKGFTLIELVLVITVTAILFGSIVTILLRSIEMFKLNETEAANQSSLNMVTSRINASLRKASGVSLASEGQVGCLIDHVNSEDEEFVLDGTVIYINGAYLTDRIFKFVCENNSNVITVEIVTIDDFNKNSLTYSTKITLREGGN